MTEEPKGGGLLEGKVAIVTGAGQGCGRGVALAFAKEGAAVSVTGRTLSKVENTAGEIAAFGGRALAYPCDVSQRSQVEAMVAATVAQFGAIDILINNASRTPTTGPQGLEAVTEEDVLDYFHSGALGSLYCMQACFPHMKERGGRIVNFGSAAGVEGLPGLLPYAMTKEAVRVLTKVAAREWGPYGITVNTVCPVSMTPAAEEALRVDPHAADMLLSRSALGRLGDVETDIGGVVVAIVGPNMGFVTGATLMVDGGMTILSA